MLFEVVVEWNIVEEDVWVALERMIQVNDIYTFAALA